MIVGEYDSIISGTVLLVNESVRRCSSASQNVTSLAPVISAAESEMVRSSASSSSALEMRRLTFVSARMRVASACSAS
jgi:hypothetical protein